MGQNIGLSVGGRPDLRRRPIVVHCGECRLEWAIGFAPLPVSEFRQLATLARCARCRSKKAPMMGWAPGDPGTNVWEWVFSGQTGVSSLTIWQTMMREQPPDPVMDGPDEDFLPGDPPGDAHDLKRCMQLLAIEPSWRARLVEVADRFPRWRGIVDAWDELTVLHEAFVKALAEPGTPSKNEAAVVAFEAINRRLRALTPER